MTEQPPPVPTTKKMSRAVLATIILVASATVAVSIFGSLGDAIGDFLSNGSLSTSSGVSNDFLLRLVSQINQSLPINVDRDTRLDSVTGVNNRITYNYTLLNIAGASADKQSISTSLDQLVRPKVRTSPKMKKFFNNGISVEYSYFGNDGHFICSFVVKPEEYQRR